MKIPKELPPIVEEVNQEAATFGHSMEPWNYDLDRMQGVVARSQCSKCGLPASVTQYQVFGLPQKMGFVLKERCGTSNTVPQSNPLLDAIRRRQDKH